MNIPSVEVSSRKGDKKRRATRKMAVDRKGHGATMSIAPVQIPSIKGYGNAYNGRERSGIMGDKFWGKNICFHMYRLLAMYMRSDNEDDNETITNYY